MTTLYIGHKNRWCRQPQIWSGRRCSSSREDLFSLSLSHTIDDLRCQTALLRARHSGCYRGQTHRRLAPGAGRASWERALGLMPSAEEGKAQGCWVEEGPALCGRGWGLTFWGSNSKPALFPFTLALPHLGTHRVGPLCISSHCPLRARRKPPLKGLGSKLWFAVLIPWSSKLGSSSLWIWSLEKMWDLQDGVVNCGGLYWRNKRYCILFFFKPFIFITLFLLV